MSQVISLTSDAQTDIHAHRILIVDFGGQYTQLIARRVRECGVYSEIMAWDIGEQAITDFKPSGIVLSGGPESVNIDNPPYVVQTILNIWSPTMRRQRRRKQE